MASEAAGHPGIQRISRPLGVARIAREIRWQERSSDFNGYTVNYSVASLKEMFLEIGGPKWVLSLVPLCMINCPQTRYSVRELLDTADCVSDRRRLSKQVGQMAREIRAGVIMPGIFLTRDERYEGEHRIIEGYKRMLAHRIARASVIPTYHPIDLFSPHEASGVPGDEAGQHQEPPDRLSGLDRERLGVRVQLTKEARLPYPPPQGLSRDSVERRPRRRHDRFRNRRSLAQDRMTREQEIEWIVNRIAESYQPMKVILFGSYAWGGATEDSDIDVLIVKETDERFIDRWVTVRGLIADPERRVPVEPIVLTPKELSRRLTRGDQFFRRIVEEGRLVYAA